MFLVYATHMQAQLIQKNDTLHLNYFIAVGEFGGKNEGLIIHNNGETIKAKSVRYNESSYGKALLVDTIVNFYEVNNNNYTVIKEEWVLSKNECEYLARVLDEIKTQPKEDNVYGNASEHYTIITKGEHHVFIDRAGNWNKFLEIKKTLNIEQCPKKL